MTGTRMSEDDVEHGTYSGSLWHRRRKIPSCAACRRAFADYTKARRDTDPEVAERNAKSRLMREHAAEYRRYYEQALSAIYATWITEGAA
jgi:hypothetical protein